MAIGTVTAGAVRAQNAGTTCPVPYPSSPGATDLLVAFLYCRRAGVTFGVSGWAILKNGSGTGGSYAVFARSALGNEAGTVSFSAAGATTNDAILGRMVKIPGAALAITGVAVVEDEGAVSPVVHSGITPEHDRALVLLFTGKQAGGNGTTNDFSGWSGASLTWSGVASGTQLGSDGAIGIGWGLQTTAATTGSLSVNCTNAASGVSIALAIRETPVTYHAIYATAQERWDGDISVPVWSANGVPNRNCYGTQSWVMQELGGNNGLFDPVTHASLEPGGPWGNWGGRCPGRDAHQYEFGTYATGPNAQIKVTWNADGDNGGWSVASVWFRPTIQRGTVLSSATLRITKRIATANPTAIRLFAIAEDDVQWMRVLAMFSRVTYMNRFYPADQLPVKRYLEQSWEDDREHTAANVLWDVPAVDGELLSPNLAPIIQEIVDRPGWRPGNRLALVMTGAAPGPALPVGGPVFYGVINTAAAQLPKLEIS